MNIFQLNLKLLFRNLQHFELLSVISKIIELLPAYLRIRYLKNLKFYYIFRFIIRNNQPQVNPSPFIITKQISIFLIIINLFNLANNIFMILNNPNKCSLQGFVPKRFIISILFLGKTISCTSSNEASLFLNNFSYSRRVLSSRVS